MAGYYILNQERVPIPASMREWSEWCTTNEAACVVRQELVGGRLISTVFLGFDLNRRRVGPPLLFETIVFDHLAATGAPDLGHPLWIERYSTWELALEGHRRAVAQFQPPPS